MLNRRDLEDFLLVRPLRFGKRFGLAILFDVRTFGGLDTILVIPRYNPDDLRRSLVDCYDVWLGIAVAVQVIPPMLFEEDMRRVLVPGLSLFGVVLVFPTAGSINQRQIDLSPLVFLDLVGIER